MEEITISVKKQTKLILLYEFCLLLFGFFYLEYKTANMTGTMSFEEIILEVGTSGVPYLWGVSLFFLILYRRKAVPIQTIFNKKRKMGIKSFVLLLLLLMSAQGLINLMITLFEQIISRFGYTFLSDIDKMSGISPTISLFLYASFAGPIIEEILFRGIVLNHLKKYGKIFSIVISAILFGLLHANIYQSTYAVLIGIVLSYIAVEFSLKWAIIFHIINNFIFGDLLYLFLEQYPTETQDVFLVIMLALFFIGAIWILVKNRNSIKNYIQKNKPDTQYYHYAFSSFLVRFYIVIHLFFAISDITKV